LSGMITQIAVVVEPTHSNQPTQSGPTRTG
jgi:hypothetical protein